MIIKKKNRIKHKNSANCIAYEYPANDKDINVAWIEITGRYPENGFVTNIKVKEIIFVAEGNGKIFIDNKEHKLENHDVVLILPTQKYFFEGNFKLVVPCSPAWYPEQHKTIE